MVFGELVIPSSRAFWDDDCIDLEEHEANNVEWEDDRVYDSEVHSLYIIDTPIVIKLFEKCILPGLKPANKAKSAYVRIFEVGDNIILLYDHKPEFTSGEVIQSISTLIENSRNIYGITSCPIALYQGEAVSPDLTCFIQTLPTRSERDDFTKLKIPNLVTGITANLLSYCIHIGRDCQLYIGFIDPAPLDSINTEPFLRVFKQLGLCIKSYYNLVSGTPPNNLYI